MIQIFSSAKPKPARFLEATAVKSVCHGMRRRQTITDSGKMLPKKLLQA
jgi:hypothetical protein